MTIGSIGKVLANQALENAVRPDPPKPAAPPVSAVVTNDTGAAIIGQIQAMQRPLHEDQELAVFIRAMDETLRVTEIFVPNPDVLVFAGLDPQGNVTRVIAPVETAQITCKILKVQPGATPSRVSVLTPRPQPKPSA